MMVATVARRDESDLKRLRAQREKRIGARVGSAVDDDRGLAGVIEHQRRQHQAVPREPDRPRPEMAHVGIKRLGAGRAQKHRAENQKAGEAVPEQITKPVAGIERHQHARVAEDPAEAEQPDGHEPDRHDRAEQFANALAALRL